VLKVVGMRDQGAKAPCSRTSKKNSEPGIVIPCLQFLRESCYSGQGAKAPCSRATKKNSEQGVVTPCLQFKRESCYSGQGAKAPCSRATGKVLEQGAFAPCSINITMLNITQQYRGIGV